MGMCMLEEWLVKSLMITESVRMLWRCIHSTGVGFLTNIEGRLNWNACLGTINDSLEQVIVPSVLKIWNVLQMLYLILQVT